MKYFTIQELTYSSTAERKHIDNTPPPEKIEALTALVDNVLDPVREAWGKPITVGSGYRSSLLNLIIRGAANSQHMQGEAADITAGNPTENRKLFNLIKNLSEKGVIEFDQLIDEKNMSWIHISYTKNRQNRKQVLRIV